MDDDAAAQGNLEVEDAYRKDELVHRQFAERIEAAVDEITGASNCVAVASKNPGRMLGSLWHCCAKPAPGHRR